MADIGSLTISVGVDSKDVSKGMKAAQSAVQKGAKAIQKSAAAIGKGFVDASKVIAGVGAAFTAVTTLIVKNSLKQVDALAKISNRLGIAIGDMQALGLAAEMAGVEFNVVGTSLQRMNRRLAEAAKGGGPAAKAIDDLGLSAEALLLKSPDEAFKEIGAAINELGGTAEKTAAAFAFFDTEGGRLLNLFENMGSIDEASNMLERLGIQINAVDAKNIEQFNDTMTVLQTILSGVADKFTAELAPVLTAVTEEITKAATGTTSFGDIISMTSQVAVETIGFIVDAWVRLKVAFFATKEAILTGVVAIAQGLQGLSQVIAGLQALFAGIARTAGVAWELISQNNAMAIAQIKETWLGFKVVVAQVVAFVVREFGEMLQSIGTGMAELGVKGSAEFLALGQSVAGSVGAMVADSKRELQGFQEAIEQPKTSIDELKNSISGIGTEMADAAATASNAFQPFIDQTAAARDQAGIDTGTSLEEVGEGSALSDRIAKRVEEIRAENEAAAAARAEGDAQEMEQLRLKQAQIASLKQEASEKEKQTEAEKDAAIKSMQQRAGDQQLSTASQIFNDLASLQDSGSKKAFKIGKAAAIAGATIDAYTSANKVFRETPGILPVRLAAAGAALTAGLVNVKKIASTQLGGGAKGGGTGGASAPAASPAPQQDQQQAPPGVNVAIQGVTPGQFFSGDAVGQLFDAINQGVGDGRTITGLTLT